MDSSITHVPLVDLKVQHEQIADDVENGFARVLEHAAFVLGPEVGEFETAFARFCRVEHCIGVANGTDALELSLRAANIGLGDEVIVPTNSFIATALAVARTGATPVLVDCDPDYHLMDPVRVGERLASETKALVPVHLYGQLAPMEELEEIVRDTKILVIEDAAQAHGATRNGIGAGGFGIAAATSFYPGKNLGAYGDAGAVLTCSDEMASKVRVLGNYGSNQKYHHPQRGFNSRLDTLQAVVLHAKLARLASWNEARRQAARRYDELLADIAGVRLPATLAGNEHVWHLYVVRVPNRDTVMRRLLRAGIGAGVHYPLPIHMQQSSSGLGYSMGDFPIAEKAANEVLSLPLFPGILPLQQERVADELRKAVS